MSKFTWLQWPVKIKNYEGPKKDKLHITARFMGESLITPEAVSECIVGVGLQIVGFDPLNFAWEPAFFGADSYVLEFVRYPKVLREIHNLTAGLYPSEYPSYRPHVTVDKELWTAVSDNNIQADQVLIVEPKLELWCRGEKTHTWLMT